MYYRSWHCGVLKAWKLVSLGCQVPSYTKPSLLIHWLTEQLPAVLDTVFTKSTFSASADHDHGSHFVDLRVNPVFFYLLILAGCPWGSWAVSSFTPLQRENIGLLCIIKRREEERKAQQRSYSWNIQRLIISPPPQVAELLIYQHIRQNIRDIKPCRGVWPWWWPCLCCFVSLDLKVQAAGAYRLLKEARPSCS